MLPPPPTPLGRAGGDGRGEGPPGADLPPARALAEAAAPGPRSRRAPGSPRARETPSKPEAGRDLGAAAPPTHPGTGAGPRERPPGMKRFPVPSRVLNPTPIGLEEPKMPAQCV
ncbi:uncharacterized protein LOC133228425 [Bos javanicus]|uniref:uncharacterized protein n=1 Tax=Bos taurus TaxID=9913 RepID=UPI000D53B98D|nr:uncharacterized protein LOC112441980 [Bos taurus]XP_061239837.1 uncharacterized protein LOC133228425 [Bos javanicus]